MPLTEPQTNKLELVICVIEHEGCRDLCRYFAAAGWQIDVSGDPQSAVATCLMGSRGHALTRIDLYEMAAFLAALRIDRETARG